VCAGRWGSIAARLGEGLRRAVDLEHWAAFQRSFEQLVDLLREISRGSGGDPPTTVTILSGDVHTTYVAEVSLGGAAGPSRIHQIVCSPFRNPLRPPQRRIVSATGSRHAASIFSALARTCRVPPPSASWNYLARRSFDNSIGELELDEEQAMVTIYRAAPATPDAASLERLYTLRLSGPAGLRSTRAGERSRESPARS